MDQATLDAFAANLPIQERKKPGRPITSSAEKRASQNRERQRVYRERLASNMTNQRWASKALVDLKLGRANHSETALLRYIQYLNGELGNSTCTISLDNQMFVPTDFDSLKRLIVEGRIVNDFVI